jgi:hypothetical protein
VSVSGPQRDESCAFGHRGCGGGGSMTINAEWPLLPLLAPFRSSPALFRPSSTPFWPSLSPPNCCAAPIHRTIHPPHSLTFSQGIFKFASFKLPCIAQDHWRGYHCRPSCSRASRTTRCHRCRRLRSSSWRQSACLVFQNTSLKRATSVLSCRAAT